MSVTIAQVNTAIENFQSVFDKINLVINAISNGVMTANLTANGSVTVGNAFLNGIFAANTIGANVIRGGNVQTNTGSLAIFANTWFLGNSSVNSFANSIYLYTTKVEVGNSTAGFMANTSAIRLNGKNYTNLDPYIIVANSGATIGTRPKLNFITTNSAIFTLTDNVAQDRVDISITAATPDNITALTITLGNSSVNSFINATHAVITNITSNTEVINTATVTSLLTVGNSSVNTVANSTQISALKLVLTGNVVLGNSTVGFMANTTAIKLNGKTYTNLDPFVIVSNTGVTVGTRPQINFVSGTSTVVDVVDDVANNRIDVTVSINSAALSAGVIGGTNTTIQYNDSGGFNGSLAFTFNETNNTVSIGNTLSVPIILFPQSKKDNLFVNTSVITSVVLDSFFLTDYRGGEYLISIKDNNANAFQVSKVLILHDGGVAAITEYGSLLTNTNIGVFTASTNATHAILNYTAGATNNTSVKIARTLMAT